MDSFVEHCSVTYVDDCGDNKQVLLNYMGWLRKQPAPKRKHSNPQRTLANKVGDVRIFLKEFGITKLLKKNEEPKYHRNWKSGKSHFPKRRLLWNWLSGRRIWKRSS